MINLIKRIWRWLMSESNAAVDAIEDPIKMNQQIVVEMSENLGKARVAHAKIKANVIGLKKDQKAYVDEQSKYQAQAEKLKARVAGGTPRAEVAEAATIIVNKIENAKGLASDLQNQIDASDKNANMIGDQIKAITKEITSLKNEAKSMKSRYESAKVNKEINKDMSSFTVGGHKDTLDKMRAKVDAMENEAQAYTEINAENTSEDDVIAKALAGDSATSNNVLLDDLFGPEDKVEEKTEEKA